MLATDDGWIHELKHDGFRIIALKDGDEVRLWSRNGRNWSADFAAIRAAVMALPATRIVPDGDAAGPAGLGAEDLRGLSLVEHRALLREHLKHTGAAIIYSEHMEGEDGEAMFRHACGLGLEGIVSKRVESRYRRALPELGEGEEPRL